MANALCYADEDIVSFLMSYFDMKATVQHLRQPKPDFVQKIYCCFLQDFGANLDQLNQLPLDVPDSVRQHTHIYASVGKIMMLSKVISSLVKNITNDIEFYPADLFNPNPKRTKRFISHLIDFYYTAQDNIDDLVKIEDKAKIKFEAKENSIDDNKDKEEKLRLLKSEIESNRIREEKMLNHIADVKQELKDVQESKCNLKSMFDQIKVDIASLITNIKAVELEILEKKERVEILAGQVIQEGERQEIEERENHLTSYRNSNAVRADNLNVLKTTSQITKSAVDLIDNELMPLLQEIQTEIDNGMEYKAGIAQQERALRTCVEEAEDQDMNMKQLNELLLSRQEKISQMQIAWKLKKDALQGEIDQAKATLAEVWRSQTEDEIVSQDLLKERMRIIRETQQFKEQIHQFDIFVATNFNKILQAMEKHNGDTQESLTAVMKAASRNE